MPSLSRREYLFTRIFRITDMALQAQVSKSTADILNFQVLFRWL